MVNSSSGFQELSAGTRAEEPLSAGGIEASGPPLLRRFAAIDWARMGMGLVGVVSIIVVWWVVALIISDNVILPSPAYTGLTLVHYLGKPYPARGDTLLGNTAASLMRILAGFAW